MTRQAAAKRSLASTSIFFFRDPVHVRGRDGPLDMSNQPARRSRSREAGRWAIGENVLRNLGQLIYLGTSPSSGPESRSRYQGSATEPLSFRPSCLDERGGVIAASAVDNARGATIRPLDQAVFAIGQLPRWSIVRQFKSQLVQRWSVRTRGGESRMDSVYLSDRSSSLRVGTILGRRRIYVAHSIFVRADYPPRNVYSLDSSLSQLDDSSTPLFPRCSPPA